MGPNVWPEVKKQREIVKIIISNSDFFWGCVRGNAKYEPPSEFPQTSPFSGIVHIFRVLTDMLMLKPPPIDRSAADVRADIGGASESPVGCRRMILG